MEDKRIGSDNSDQLKELGFEAGETVYKFTPDFTLNDLRDALFASTYSQPKFLEVRLSALHPVVLRVVVSLVEQAYQRLRHGIDDSPLGCYELPGGRLTAGC